MPLPINLLQHLHPRSSSVPLCEPSEHIILPLTEFIAPNPSYTSINPNALLRPGRLECSCQEEEFWPRGNSRGDDEDFTFTGLEEGFDLKRRILTSLMMNKRRILKLTKQHFQILQSEDSHLYLRRCTAYEECENGKAATPIALIDHTCIISAPLL